MHRHKKQKPRHEAAPVARHDTVSTGPTARQKLELVLKCDTSGCIEAIVSAVGSINVPGVDIDFISSDVGAISKSDIFMAETGSRLIVGFGVGFMPHMEQLAVEHNVEIRIYEVIYRLLEDMESIAGSLVPHERVEEIIGSARVVALFKSSRRGIILGCEVTAGKLAVGRMFRIVGAMGPIYSGKIESLHIEKDAVREAIKGEQVGLKIRDFNRARLGDLVESYRPAPEQHAKPWEPQGKIIYL